MPNVRTPKGFHIHIIEHFDNNAVIPKINIIKEKSIVSLFIVTCTSGRLAKRSGGTLFSN
jgi:hypothetical protein